jgi:RimJ/RimL family protein N-acetyltransferase
MNSPNTVDRETPERESAGERPESAAFPDITRDDVFRLETRRLWLRWLRHADVPAVERFASLKEVAGMTGSWPHPLPVGEAERRIFASRKANATGQALSLGITLRGRPDHVIGFIGLGWAMTGANSAPGLGYMLHPEHWGRGYAPEAAQALLDAAFTYSAVPEVAASTHITNAASRRVLEKCGFRHVGSGLQNLPARGGMVATDHFLLDRKTWAALSGWGRGHDAAGGSAPAFRGTEPAARDASERRNLFGLRPPAPLSFA